ncbi:Beta-monoglucosyldiacylglycerol synthase [Candidatus Xiphinematobacter sp. Idaho Grape]|uniref:glycosyltransferase family 2 protein n=1 Tax=Candidatus Xiphinematobacter sp. Idaho Grape TaxID=1704307 RepID=UPI00070647F3|nr:glycosyltransferase family 2 protein [Candidatus Xiphinematobacter sp. Idaho Grape]ALJ56981.1 Beta-monoglucosyldiacylglycerol synthase [Candidatus Xiphinematobacter sp. Idaho Grape]
MDTVFSGAIWSVCYLLVVASLSIYGIHRLVICYLFLRYKNQGVQPLRRWDHLPLVTVQLPIFNEYYVGKRLLSAVSRIDYPREKLQIQILDDSSDETRVILERGSRLLRKAGFDVVYLYRKDRVGFKAGALAAGLEAARGEFIFILDADFVPPPCILLETIHHFTNPKIGMVQMRWGHLNRYYSLLTRIQAIFLDGHFLLEQTARCRSGRFFNFNGTAGIWRKSCIETSGGWHYDTLTEDLDLSYRAQMGGWKFLFLPDIVVPAELPVDMNGFKSQQHRWTKGSIQTCKKLLPLLWKSNIPLLTKLEGTIHLVSNFSYLLLLLLCLLILPNSFAATHSTVYMFLVDVPIFIATSISILFFYIIAQQYVNPRGWLREIWLFPMLLALAAGMSINNARGVIEALFNHRSEFKRTPKYGIKSGFNSRHRGASARYWPLCSSLPLAEVLFTVYFGFCIGSAILNGQWFSIPFLLVFLVGFSYVAFLSIALWLQRWLILANPQDRQKEVIA